MSTREQREQLNNLKNQNHASDLSVIDKEMGPQKMNKLG